jgi:hypothetical protein
MDQWRSQSTMDHGQRISLSSLKCGLPGVAGLRSLPQLNGEGEEDEGVLTQGGVGSGVTELGRRQ